MVFVAFVAVSFFDVIVAIVEFSLVAMAVSSSALVFETTTSVGAAVNVAVARPGSSNESCEQEALLSRKTKAASDFGAPKKGAIASVRPSPKRYDIKFVARPTYK